MLNKAHSNICVALSNSTCCCFQLFSTQKTSRKVSSNSWKCTFPFLIAKRVGVGGNYYFPKKYRRFPVDYYLSTHIHIQKEQKEKNIRIWWSFIYINLNCWRFCGWTQLNLKSLFHDFGPLALLQIIKDTSGRASTLLSYKLTPAKINILHMCLLHLFPMVPDRETSPIYWLSLNKMI